jgi:hypothetical protein
MLRSRVWVPMIRRIAALLCCLSLLPVSALAADGVAATRPASIAEAVKAAPVAGPIRTASLSSDPHTIQAERTRWTRRPSQDEQDVEKDYRSWTERHPVWTGAILGFTAGFGLTYLAAHDNNDDAFLKVIDPGMGALVWGGGVGAGLGALVGWGIGRDE